VNTGNRSTPVPSQLYGGTITAFYAGIIVNKHRKSSRNGVSRFSQQPVAIADILWDDIKPYVRFHQLPPVEITNNSEFDTKIARIVEILNTCDDFLVFRIAMNTLCALIRPHEKLIIYSGEYYHPDKLEQALSDSRAH
jgi:hypothetical protein